MVWYYTNERPADVTAKIRLGQVQHTINFNVQTSDAEGYALRYQSVTLGPGVWSYDAIVNAIVCEQYPADKMQAVINNYLADQEGVEAKKEMDDMQAWRRYAKEVAKEALKV